MTQDIIIKNGKILDGTGNPWFLADIGITEGKISKISPNLSTELDDTIVINADGLVASPGFIECLAQQGITTIVVGNCGMSYAPLNPEKDDYFSKTYEINGKIRWHSFKEYLDVLENQGSSLNVVPLVGFGIVRRSVMEDAPRRPSKKELEQMQSYVEEAGRSIWYLYRIDLSCSNKCKNPRDYRMR